MWIGLGVVASLVVLVAGGMLWASRLPEATHAELSFDARASADRAFEVIADVGAYPTWMEGIGQMTATPGADGKPAFEEKRGDRSMTLTVEEATRPQRVRIAMKDSTGAYAAHWDYRIEARPDGGTTIHLSERAELKSAVFKAAVHLGGVDTNVKRVGASLRAKLDAQ